MLADASVNDLQAHSSPAVEEPATGCSETSASLLFSFFDGRDFFGDFCGVAWVASREASACVDAPADVVSTATGIAVVGAEKLHAAKKLAAMSAQGASSKRRSDIALLSIRFGSEGARRARGFCKA